MKQIKFKARDFYLNLAHGGTLRNKRKGRGARPLDRKKPIHLVLKSNLAGTGRSLRSYKYFAKLERVLQMTAVTYGVRVEQRSWNGNHAHFLIRIHNRQLYKAFIRVLTAKIVYVVTEGRRRLQNGLKLWKYRPFTRVVQGLRAYETAVAYIRLNELEARGTIPYRKNRLRGLEPGELALVWN